MHKRRSARSYSILARGCAAHWLQFTISSGRLVVGAAGLRNFNLAQNSRNERLNIRTIDGEMFVQYDALTPEGAGLLRAPQQQADPFVAHPPRRLRGGGRGLSAGFQ